MKKVHLIMPMGGAGSRFYKNGYAQPKPLIEIQGHPFLYWATESIRKFVDIQDLTFVVLQEHIDQFSIDSVISSYYPQANIVVLPQILPGPVYTCLAGVDCIEDEAPILFNDCDHMFRCEKINTLLNNGCFDWDGGLLTFESQEPQFSYVRYNEEGQIIGTIEKEVVSHNAICGAYIFRSAALFKEISKEYIANCTYKECFMSGMYNVMCQKGMPVRDFPLDFHVEFGTPEEYIKAENSPHFAEFQP